MALFTNLLFFSYKPTTEELLPNGTIYKFSSVNLLPPTTEGLMPNAFIFKFTVLELYALQLRAFCQMASFTNS